MRFSIHISIIFFVLCYNKTFSQSQDSARREVKKILFEDNRLFNGVRFGADIAGIGYGLIANTEEAKLINKYELNADLGIRRWFLSVDYGRGTYTNTDEDTLYNTSNYKSEGYYFRIGGDYRISRSAKSFIFYGLRFGRAFFTEDVTYRMLQIKVGDVVVNPAGEENRYTSNWNANWIEMTPGIKVYIWNNLYLGYTIRLKFLVPKERFERENPNYIPGYGVGNRNTTVGFSFHVMYRIPFGKDPVIPLNGK